MHKGSNRNWYILLGNHFGICIHGSEKKDLWLDQNLGTAAFFFSEI